MALLAGKWKFSHFFLELTLNKWIKSPQNNKISKANSLIVLFT